MKQKQDVLTIRIEPKLKEKIDMLTHEKIKTKSGIIREALTEFIQREEKLKGLKSEMAKKFASNKISFEDLVRIIGYEEASKVAFFVERAKKAFKGFK
ncbi:MAG: ribbon-helix-helix protein, CopG family [Candidatus Aenigmatarchaeota archaeon]